MRTFTKTLLGAVTAATLLAAAPASAQAAEKFPTHPVRIITWAGPGGAFDTLARMLAEGLSQRWDETVTVENKVGAGGIVGTQQAARAAADGHTLLITTNSAHILNALLKENLSFDPRKDFTAVSKLADGQTTFAVAAASPYNSMAEFLAAAAKKEGGFSYASFAIGSASHLMGEHLQRISKAPLVHVPYANGEMAALTDVLGGRLDAVFMSEGTALAQTQGGKVKVLAITGNQRTAMSPDVPTFAEQGLGGLDLSGWIGMFVPAGTPEAVVQQLSDDIQAVVSGQQFNQRMVNMGFSPVGNGAEEFAAQYARDFERWAEMVKETGFTPQ